ncbi:MAG: RNA polymerase-binding protein DksA [Rudaea sp.]
MATNKRKPAPAAKKKAGASKSNPARKPAAKKTAASSKPAPRKAAKPAKAAKPVPKKKPAPAKTARAAAKPQRPAKKIVPAKPAAKAVAKKPVVAAIKKPAAAPVKTAPQKPSATTKGKMAATATTVDNVSREDGRYALPSTVVIDLPANYRPNPKEEYMGPRHLAYFRAKLQKWREDLVEESKQTIDNLRDEVRDVGDEAERATRETENSLELRTRDRYRKLIGKIDKGLKRIEEGRYGFCEETDEEIGLDRLEARPIATLSLDAQERWEHRQKQMGD